jgi:hypothetical protein
MGKQRVQVNKEAMQVHQIVAQHEAIAYLASNA